MPQINEIRKRKLLSALQALRETCVRDVKSRIADCKADGHKCLTADDDADELYTGVALAVAALRDADAKAVDRAIEKVYAGTYGKCEDCDGEIPEKRLVVHPFAAHCVPCKSARETVTPQARRFPTGLRTQRNYS